MKFKLTDIIPHIFVASIILSIVGIIPTIESVYGLSKVFFVSLGAILFIAIEIYFSIRNKTVSHTLRPAHIPVLLLFVSYIISTYFQSPDPMEAWHTRTLLITGLTITYLVASARLKADDVSKITSAIVIAGAILAVSKVIHSLGLIKNLPLASVGNPLWNLVGSPISLITICAIALILAFFSGLQSTKTAIKSTYLAIAIFMGITIAITVGEALTKADTKFINVPYSIGYSIAIDILKNPRTALMGIGPDNYSAAFSFFKPRSYNDLEIWDVRFISSSNEIFHIFTTNGILGATALGLIITYLIKSIISKLRAKEYGISIATAIIILSMCLFPAQPATLIVLYALIIIHTLTGSSKTLEFNNLFYRTAGIGITAIIAITGLYWTGRFIVADYHFKKSLVALQNNQASEALSAQALAMKNNPYHEEYRVAYSQTNLLIAKALAQKTEISDTDKQAFAALVQESIKFANVAVGLNIQNVASWENRARVLQQVSSFVKGADAEAVRSFNNAVILDPNNPKLLVEYGQFLQNKKQINAAIKLFEEAVTLKPNDYANARYNLAAAYEAQGRYVEAGIQYENTLKQIKSDNAEYQNIQNKVTAIAEAIKKAQNTNAQQPTSNTTTPTISPRPTTPPITDANINTPTENNPQNVNDSEGLLPITPSPTPQQ